MDMIEYLLSLVSNVRVRQLTSVLFYIFILEGSVCCGLTQAATDERAELGANKFDLLLQYIGRASGGDGSPAYLQITRAMAEKAILDAEDVGFTFFRVSVSGYGPTRIDNDRSNDLGLWLADAPAYWRLVDVMFDDLDRAGIRLVPTLMWNPAQFPALVHETEGSLISDPHSKSRMLLDKYVEEFIDRYKTRKTILFYELSNELNLFADLDLGKRCAGQKPPPSAGQCSVMDHFTTGELISFAGDMVGLVKRLDPERSISSGYSLPRAGAYHLAAQPEFSAAGPDWTLDTIEQFQDNLLRTQAMFDIMSVHVYPGQDGARFGHDREHGYEILKDVGAIARSGRKKVFVGEFGDAGMTSFMDHMAESLSVGMADYGAVWIWEFYQFSTDHSFDSAPSRYSLEPGFTDDLITRLSQIAPKTSFDASRLNDEEATPRVVLTWPLPCRRIDTTTELSAVASAAQRGKIDHVEFLIDGVKIGSAKAPPYRAVFNPTEFGKKRISLAARAIDSNGRTSEFSSPILINGFDGDCSF
jgi:hypothetical protein